MAEAADSLLGGTIAHYRVLERLGGGGMGVVYRAQDLKLGRFVALKFLPESAAADPAAKERLQREARAASALDHPNICTIHEIGEDGGRLFIAMQCLEGATLGARIGGRPLPLDTVLEWGAEIADGLEAAHAAGIVHRDIKPANIFITDRGHVKILDFGLAKLARRERGETDLPTFGGDDALLTSPGATLGTVAYMSPEQVRGEDLDFRSDLFSFGLVLYEMATGRQAFAGPTAGVIQEAILNRDPIPAATANPALPSKLGEIIAKALEKDRNLRCQSAAELRADLRRLRRDSDSDRSVARAQPVSDPRSIAPATPSGHASGPGGGGPSSQRPAAGMNLGAPVPPPSRRRWYLPVAAIVIAAVAAGAFFYFRRGPMMAAGDGVIVADFVNTTGDPVFDGSLRLALAAKLAESPYFTVVSDASIAQTLRFMEQPPTAQLSSDLARQVCQRDGSRAVLAGSISGFGDQYALTLDAVSCDTGASLARAEADAAGKSQVLPALGKLSSMIRGRLGESLASMRKFDTPIEQVTTSSLEALQAYSLGEADLNASRYADCVPALDHAAALDPNFAMAYAVRGTCHSDLSGNPSLSGEAELAAQDETRAFALKDRASERERFYISSHYYDFAIADLDRSEQIYKLWEQTYPHDAVPWVDLGNIYRSLGDEDDAFAQYVAAVRLDPHNLIAVGNLGVAYRYRNDFEAAKTLFERMVAQSPEVPRIYAGLAIIALDQNDAAGFDRQVAWFTSHGQAAGALVLQADAAAYRGQISRYRALTAQLTLATPEAREPGASQAAGEAITEAIVGDPTLARTDAARALTTTSRDTADAAIWALAMAGEPAQAEKLLAPAAQKQPGETLANRISVPVLRAAIALDRSPSQAVAILQPLAQYRLAPGQEYLYTLGVAELKAKDGKDASAAFQEIRDHRGLFAPDTSYPLAELGLARARVLTGDLAGARTAYQDFLALWQNADPDLPVMRQAHAEYAKLLSQSSSVPR